VRKEGKCMKEEIRRIDPLTREEFIAVRVNQRFAIPANRIKFHNESASDLRKEREVINNPINKTQRLLRKLMGNKREAEFSYDYLDGYGIDYRCFNHYFKINGIRYPSIYEFTFIVDQANKKIKIINNGRF
jgi:hypothetical protein